MIWVTGMIVIIAAGIAGAGWCMYREMHAPFADALTLVCARCDGFPWRTCSCAGDCGRRDCPAGETARDLGVLADEAAFSAAYEALLDEVRGGDDLA